MKPGSSRLVPPLSAAVTAFGLLLGGCLGPNLDSGNPLVVTENSGAGGAKSQPAEHAAAVAEMRAKGAAGETMAYPDVFATARNTQLATRSEPRPVPDVQAIEAELAAIARRKQYATSPQELAAMKARAAELQRLVAQAQAMAQQRKR
jgi:hypothetical protein